MSGYPTHADGAIHAGSPAVYAIRETIERIMDAGGYASRPYISAISWPRGVNDLIGSIAQECADSYMQCECGRAIWRCDICRGKRPVIDHPECGMCATCFAKA